MALTLLLGGARSGKSTLAVRLARAWDGPVTFIATAVGSDPDMAARIARHRAERPSSWHCIEEPIDLAAALERSAGSGVIVDCVTVWVANLLERRTPDEILAEAESVAEVAARREAATIAVSNEVGLGVHPATPQGREYRDLLGRVNALWAEAAGRSLFMVAGQALELQPVSIPGE
jgi:adenosyl cobinamide kinase/adenosyl cobinamide phosphate guanylyltransferase